MENGAVSAERRKAVGECIGILAMEWADLEFVVDACIACFHDFFFGKSIEPRKPVNFSRKATYLKAAIGRLDTMAWAQVYLPAIERLSAASEKRNWFIHGRLVDASDDHTITFAMHDSKASPVGIKYNSVKYEEIYNTASDAKELCDIFNGLLTITLGYIDRVIASTQNAGNDTLR